MLQIPIERILYLYGAAALSVSSYWRQKETGKLSTEKVHSVFGSTIFVLLIPNEQF